MAEWNLHEWVVPVLLESSDGYKPLAMRKRFGDMARVMARQAYWLAWRESMERLSPKLVAVRFKKPAPRSRELAQTPVWREGHAPTLRELASFEAARKRAISKLMGKYAPEEGEFLAQCIGDWDYDKTIGLDGIDDMIAVALGPQLAAFKRSMAERGEIEALLFEGGAAKSSKGASRL